MSAADRIAIGFRLVEEAGIIAAAAFSNADLHIESKGPGDLVSEADFAIEQLARQIIGAAFPDDGFIGEEYGGTALAQGFTWLIDPIDGTVNFARKLGYYCVSLALLADGRPIAAWVLDPERRELFHAGEDGICRLNGRPVHCAGVSDFGESVIGLGFSPRHDLGLGARLVGGLTSGGAEHRRLGAGALCLAHVAVGRLDAYLEAHMNPWDAVGGLYLAACAGAVTGDYLGMGGLASGAPVIAVAPGILEQLLATLPAPFSGTPLHRQNEQRSAGELRRVRKPSPTVET
jgi:myo-inositol-1(or 4)-monophosphatase